MPSPRARDKEGWVKELDVGRKTKDPISETSPSWDPLVNSLQGIISPVGTVHWVSGCSCLESRIAVGGFKKEEQQQQLTWHWGRHLA